MSNTLMSITHQICFKSYFHCSHCDKLLRLSAVTVFAWSLAGRKHQTRPDHEPSVSTRTPLGLHAARTNIHAGGRRHTHNSTYKWTWWLGKHVKITGQYSNPLWSPSEATLSWPNAPSSHGGQRCKEERKARKEKKKWRIVRKNMSDSGFTLISCLTCSAKQMLSFHLNLLSSQTQKFPVCLLGKQKLLDAETETVERAGPKQDRYRGCQEDFACVLVWGNGQ